MAPVLQSIVLGTSISISFVLAGRLRAPQLRVIADRSPGNAITQSFMTVPALLTDFPDPKFHDFSTRATLLGRQWAVCWTAGNVFFRPISTLAALGYAFSTYNAQRSSTVVTQWTPFAVATLMHVVIILHSAINMQPLNDKLASLNPEAKGSDSVAAASQAGAEGCLRKWATFNWVRIIAPLIAGVLAISHPLP
jgi:hypothetical protein